MTRGPGRRARSPPNRGWPALGTSTWPWLRLRLRLHFRPERLAHLCAGPLGVVATLDLVGVDRARDCLVRVPHQARDAARRPAHVDEERPERVAELVRRNLRQAFDVQPSGLHNRRQPTARRWAIHWAAWPSSRTTQAGSKASQCKPSANERVSTWRNGPIRAARRMPVVSTHSCTTRYGLGRDDTAVKEPALLAEDPRPSRYNPPPCPATG